MKWAMSVLDMAFLLRSASARSNGCKSRIRPVVGKSQEYLNQGYVWTVDMDLEKFFDVPNGTHGGVRGQLAT